MLSEHPILEKRPTQIVLMCLVVVLIAATGYRVQRNYAEPSLEFNYDQSGHSDFHNGTYLPTLAFRHGDNPYAREVCEKYTMPRSAPMYSPFAFVLHLPFTLFDLPTADVVFFLYNAALLLTIACLAIKFCDDRWKSGLFLLVACLILLSRPGHITLFTGYFTAELALGTALALHFARSRPWLSGLGLLLVSSKPNFFLPLMILMLCRRDFRAVVLGVVFSAVGALAGFGWLATRSGPSDVIRGFIEGQESLHEDVMESPFNSWTRLDVTAMAAKILRANPGDLICLTAMLGLLVAPGFALSRIGGKSLRYGASGLSGMIICLSVLLSIYHQSYDSLILIVPWVGFTFYGHRVVPELSSVQRWSVSVLTAVPAVNYVSSLTFRERLGLDPTGRLWQLITLVNCVCLAIALGILMWAAFRVSRQLPGEELRS